MVEEETRGNLVPRMPPPREKCLVWSHHPEPLLPTLLAEAPRGKPVQPGPHATLLVFNFPRFFRVFCLLYLVRSFNSLADNHNLLLAELVHGAQGTTYPFRQLL